MSFENIPLPDLIPLWKQAIWETVLRIEREKQYKPNAHTPKKKDNEKILRWLFGKKITDADSTSAYRHIKSWDKWSAVYNKLRVLEMCESIEREKHGK